MVDAVELGELLANGGLSYGIVQPGHHDPTGIPIVRVSDLESNRIDRSSPLRVSPEIEEKHSRTRLKGGEILVSIVGTIGRVAVVPTSLAGWNTARAIAVLRPRDLADSAWIRYCLESPPVQRQMQLRKTDTVQATLNLRDLKRIEVPYPPTPERARITGVLGVLDDLIDTDRDLVDSLVKQADSVAADFHSAGEKETFGKVCDVFGGATPKTSEPSYWNGDLHWATPSDITALRSPYLFATSRQITQVGLDSCSSKLHPPGSILMTSRATIGAFALTQISTATNQGFIVVEPHREEDRYFLFHEMRRRVPEFMDRANGSTFREISRGTFKSLSVEWPSESDRRELADKLKPLHRAAIELEREIAELESRRDELLSLLLSGRVRVDKVAA